MEGHSERAEGYLDLGLPLDAWEALEDVPPEERATPEALKLRLRICTTLVKWDMGSSLAGVLKDSLEEAQRESVA